VTHVKRKALALILIIVIALSVASWLVYSQISDLQNQISELKAQNADLHEQISELQDQNTELQNQTGELNEQLNELQSKTYRGLNVTIAAFEWIGGFNPYVGLAIEGDANVTVQNNEAYAISGFKLTLTLVHKSTGVALSGIEAVVSIGTLHAFEFREITGHAYWHVGDDLGDADCRVVLSLGNFVVDEKTFPLS
jgi:FtsZ-binding cell division protein ZapB